MGVQQHSTMTLLSPYRLLDSHKHLNEGFMPRDNLISLFMGKGSQDKKRRLEGVVHFRDPKLPQAILKARH